MARRYLIDGYNLIHRLGLIGTRPEPGALQEARRRFLDFLVENLVDDAGRTTVVFDAANAPKHLSAEQWYGGIHILFAKTLPEADDLLALLVEQDADPRQLCVVSSDREVQKAGKRRHSQIMDCDAFLDELERRKAARPAPAAEVREIAGDTAEWLAVFGKLESDPDLELGVRRLKKKGR